MNMTIILLAFGVALQLAGAAVLSAPAPPESLMAMVQRLWSTVPPQQIQSGIGTVMLLGGALIAGAALLPRKKRRFPARYVLHPDARRGRVSRQNATALLGAALLPPLYFLLAAFLLV